MLCAHVYRMHKNFTYVCGCGCCFYIILNSNLENFIIVCGPVAQWIRHLTTDQGIPGSNPGRVIFI